MCKLKKLTAHWFSRFFFFIIYWFFYPIRTDCQIQSVNSLNNMKIWEIFCEKRFCIKKSLRNYVNSLLPCVPLGKSLKVKIWAKQTGSEVFWIVLPNSSRKNVSLLHFSWVQKSSLRISLTVKCNWSPLTRIFLKEGKMTSFTGNLFFEDIKSWKVSYTFVISSKSTSKEKNCDNFLVQSSPSLASRQPLNR